MGVGQLMINIHSFILIIKSTPSQVKFETLQAFHVESVCRNTYNVRGTSAAKKLGLFDMQYKSNGGHMTI